MSQAKSIRLQFNNYYDLIRRSLRGDAYDYTTGSLKRAIVLLAIPMILELSLESVFAVVDMFFVGKLGENAIATVGLTESVIALVYSVAIGLSTAATALVARRTGEKNPDEAAHAAAQVISIAMVVALIITAIAMFFASDILRLMGASPEVVRQGSTFTRVMLGGSLAIILLFLINGIFRGAGNAAMAMRSLWLASLSNIILCPIFISLWGLTGAAIATTVGRSIGVLYQVYFLVKGTEQLKLQSKHFRVNWSAVKNIVTIAWPATFQFIIASGSWIFLAMLVARTGGTTASAGYQVAIRNVVFFILPAWGLSNAAATLVGQNLGAGQPERAEKSVLLTARYNGIFMSIVMLIFLFFASPIISIFTSDPGVHDTGTKALRIIGTGYIFYGVGMVMVQALNGAGDTRTPTLIHFFGFWIFQIPFAYVLAKYTSLGFAGAFVAIPVAETVMAITSYLYFRAGRWKVVKI